MSVKLLGSPKNETDEITYDKNGIKKIALWSEAFMDWVDLPLEFFKTKYPKKYEALEEELRDEELSRAERPFFPWL